MIPTEVLIEAFRITLDFAANTADKFDDNRFAETIVKLYGKEPSYEEFDAQVEIVKRDDDLSTQEKLDLIYAIAVQKDEARRREADLKAKYAEIVENGMVRRAETTTKIVVVVLKAFLTGGFSLLFDGISKGSYEPDEAIDEDEEAA